MKTYALPASSIIRATLLLYSITPTDVDSIRFGPDTEVNQLLIHNTPLTKMLQWQHFIKGYGIYINLDNFTFEVAFYIGTAKRNL